MAGTLLNDRRFRKAVATVGEINVVWDDIEMALWYIFDVLLDVTWKRSFTIFFSQQNHRARREMLEALADVTLDHSSERYKKLSSLIGRVKRAATKRNDLAHGVWASVKAGRKIEIHRIPVKRDVRKLETVRLTPVDMAKIKEQLSKLYVDLYDFSYPPWREKAKRLHEDRRLGS